MDYLCTKKFSAYMLETSGFKNQLENLVQDPEIKTYLLAVSGGADSMVLAHCFNDLGLSFQVAHINYKLRGKDSDLDQKVVQDFCTNKNIKLHVYEVSEIDKKPENSIQLWARALRYEFFQEIQKKGKSGVLSNGTPSERPAGKRSSSIFQKLPELTASAGFRQMTTIFYAHFYLLQKKRFILSQKKTMLNTEKIFLIRRMII